MEKTCTVAKKNKRNVETMLETLGQMARLCHGKSVQKVDHSVVWRRKTGHSNIQAHFIWRFASEKSNYSYGFLSVLNRGILAQKELVVSFFSSDNRMYA